MPANMQQPGYKATRPQSIDCIRTVFKESRRRPEGTRQDASRARSLKAGSIHLPASQSVSALVPTPPLRLAPHASSLPPPPSCTPPAPFRGSRCLRGLFILIPNTVNRTSRCVGPASALPPTPGIGQAPLRELCSFCIFSTAFRQERAPASSAPNPATPE